MRVIVKHLKGCPVAEIVHVICVCPKELFLMRELKKKKKKRAYSILCYETELVNKILAEMESGRELASPEHSGRSWITGIHYTHS